MTAQSAFRRGNEAIARNAEKAGLNEQPINFICECADERCFEAVSLTLAEYQRLSLETTIVAAGHPVD
jgi:hypothetical protein